ncbi:nicotinate phosphoribosyltransferase [Rhodocyclaceae bacterium SMB388]
MNVTSDPYACESALLTDLYELTMMQAYYDNDMHDTAVFEFFVRRLPERRNFLIAAGLEQVVDYLEGLRFESHELEWLAACGRFRPDFVNWLGQQRFIVDVDAMPEGTVFFADEPILRVVAPLPVAQFVESRIINLLQFQCMVASKAARCVLAARGKLLVDFGLRRSHGAEAGLLSARASYLAGFGGTATVLAGMRWDIPLYGTMAHSFIQAHDSESTAFEQFARSHPAANTMLIDTYDTEAGAASLAGLAKRLRRDGIEIQAVRLDSGDLGDHARKVRSILDADGLKQAHIFASGNLDEETIERLVAEGAPIDGFGVGTRMNTSADQPYLDCAYKLQEYAGIARRKRSEGKATFPGRKQVFRSRDPQGRFCGDLLTTADDHQPGESLLEPVMRSGLRIGSPPSLQAIRARVAEQLAALPAALRDLTPAPSPYPVVIGESLQALIRTVDARAGSQARRPDQP